MNCTSLLAREFWLDGKLDCPCCCLFIGYEDGSWKRVLYDVEAYNWVFEDSDEIPNINEPLGDESFYYPYKEYIPKGFNDAGELSELNYIDNNNVNLEFSSGINISLSFDADTYDIKISKST